jgi:hypothetical protein
MVAVRLQGELSGLLGHTVGLFATIIP